MGGKVNGISVTKVISFHVVLCVVIVRIGNCDLYEGEMCKQSGSTGICRRLSNCTIAINQLKHKRSHSLKRCGWSKNEEVICCPVQNIRDDIHGSLDENSTLDPSTIWNTPDVIRIGGERRSERECKEIHKISKMFSKIDYNVLNGEDAERGLFPHMAALGVEDDDGKLDWQKCGASLISLKFLLTAAHCSVCVSCRNPIKVRLGVSDIMNDESAQDIDIKKVILHPNYTVATKHNDIALIELETSVEINNYTYPACLYTKNDDPPLLHVTGWGVTKVDNLDSRSEILQMGTVDPVPIDQCNSTFKALPLGPKIILNSQICAKSDSDSCQGDSGGPLQKADATGIHHIVGVVSYGISCGGKLPGVYTRVSFYLDWIEKYVWPD